MALRAFHPLKAFMTLLGFLIPSVSVSMMIYLLLMTIHTKNVMDRESNEIQVNSLMEIQKVAKLLNNTNSSASNKARALSSCMNGTQLSFHQIKTQVVPALFEALDFHGGYVFLATIHGQVLIPTKVKDTRISIDHDGLVKVRVGSMYHNVDLFCHSFTDDSKAPKGMKIGSYKFYCSTLDIAGVPMLYVLQYPAKGFAKLVDRNKKAIHVLVVVLTMTVVHSFVFMLLTLRAKRREMFLCAALIKQLEATQQAERKSMNKTKAYAGINHDVRGSLAAVKGFIDFCEENAREGKLSELRTNLSQMKTCTEDLLNILKSSLDMSKLESGKASLELEDFNLAQLLEEIVDMFYPLGMKKGVDIVLDPCDGSILKLPLVKGDRLKLKQILCNLISNATKFTSEGHISVRAMVNRNNLNKAIINSNRTPTLKMFSWFYQGRKSRTDDLDAFHAVKENPNEVEIEFEIDDTGKGIPKDKQLSIFEDYVQVKETAAGQEGSGLGLGIVQSLVRIMKGDLRIVEKERGEKGTCFRFNIFLSTCENEAVDLEENRSLPASPGYQYFQFMSPKTEGSSHMVMCIQGEERRRVLKKYIENLHIKVTIINPERDLGSQLERLKRRLDLSNLSPVKPASSSLSDYLSPSPSSNSELESNRKSPFSIILFVIDSNVSSYEFDRTISRFRKEIQACKFVWLEEQICRQAKRRRQNLESDYVINKPFHGSRLTLVLSLLPEFKGICPYNMSTFSTRLTSQKEAMGSVNEKAPKKIESSKVQLSSFQLQFQQEGIREEAETNTGRPLRGKTILLVEDNKMLQYLTSTSLRKLGADVEICSNGKEAVNQVLNIMRGEKKEASSSKTVPYDYIFMDCEMPIMDGYKATKMIREGERRYGGHIPIIALSAHAMPEEASKSIAAGMDFHLNKPLQVDKLLEVIQSIHADLNRF